MRLGHMGDFHPRRNAANTSHIDLHHRRSTADQIVFELAERIQAFPHGDGDRSTRRQERMLGNIISRHRFFKPSNIKLLKHFCAAFGLGQIKRLIGVNHDFIFWTNGVAHRV